MAVEARHLNFFAPHQLLGNREIMNVIDGHGSLYNDNQFGYGSGTTAMYNTNNNSSVVIDSFPKNNQNQMSTTFTAPMKDDSSGLTCTLPPTSSVSRKRPRENFAPITGYGRDFINRCSNHLNNGSLSFFGEDVSSQLILEQLDIDRLVSQHMEKVRFEIEESRKRHSRKIIAAVEIGMINNLRAKEDEIEKIGKLNHALEDRLKSLYVENQIWRDLAQSNEATANALRNNLEILLSQANTVPNIEHANALADDAESCCGSSGSGGCDDRDETESGGWRTLGMAVVMNNNLMKRKKMMSRWCKKCGEKEACVLLLPCRHLCLCAQCAGSSLQTCPICKSNQTASVHVNLS